MLFIIYLLYIFIYKYINTRLGRSSWFYCSSIQIIISTLKPMYKSQKTHSVILTSILDSSMILTSHLSKLMDLLISNFKEPTANDVLLMSTSSHLSTLDTNLKFLQIKIQSELKNDNELFLQVIDILKQDVLPIFEQCLKLLKYVVKDIVVSDTDDDELIQINLLRVLNDLTNRDSLKSLIDRFSIFLENCLQYSTRYKTSSYTLYETQSLKTPRSVDMISIPSLSSKDSIFDTSFFNYEVEYYSISSRLDILNDSLDELDSCIDGFKSRLIETDTTSIMEDEREIDYLDDIFGFEFETSFDLRTERLEIPKIELGFNYCLNKRRIILS